MFAVVYIPQFPLQAALRHEPELWAKPLALVDPTLRTPAVCELTEAARALGISPGLTATQAMARCSQVLIRPRSSAQEEAATNALLQCAYAFSPHLENSGPGMCTLDLGAVAAVKGFDPAAWKQWGAKLQAALAQLQLSAAIGLGATPNVARHAARWGGGLEVVEAPVSFIHGLPVAALEPSSHVAQLLKRWGIRTVGELLALNSEALTARLGLEALGLVASASSTALRPLHWTQPPEDFAESFEFEPPVETLEPLLFLLRRFVDQLTQRLHPRGFVAEVLLLQLRLESGQKQDSRVRLPQPTGQADVLFRTLHSHLENVRTDSAIRAVGLTVLPAEGKQKQLGLFDTVLPDPQQFQETLARLTAVLGPNRVGTPVLDNSHQPDAFHLLPPDFENAPVPLDQPGSCLTQPTALRRYRPALRVDVAAIASELPDRPAPGSKSGTHIPGVPAGAPTPVSIRCVLGRGKLKLTIGPWRTSGHWWEAGGWEREEWDATTSDGQVLRLVHLPEGWFVEGVID